MSLVHDTPVTCQDIFDDIAEGLNESGLKWFSATDITNAIQDSYNKIVALLCPITKSCMIPQKASPYYNLLYTIPNFMYLQAIYNPSTNRWLRGTSYRYMKSRYLVHMAHGEPLYFNVADFRRVQIWPFLATAAGGLYIMYKASAPIITMDHIPVLPYSVCRPLMVNHTMMDLCEQAREFSKAQMWHDRIFMPEQRTKSLWQQAKDEIHSLARMDEMLVLEPYRWLIHGGSIQLTWINNETPVGEIDGSNNIFTLSGTPNPTGSLILTLDRGDGVGGVVLFEGEAYTLNGQTITLETAYIPPENSPGLRAWYTVA